MELILPRIADPKKFKNTWIDVSTEEYHSDKTAANYSSLKHMLRSPAAYLYNLQNQTPASKQMQYGTIIHMALLESEKFKSMYVVEPIFSGVTKSGEVTTSKNASDVKRKYEDWRNSLLPGALVVTQEQLDGLNGITKSMISNPKILAAVSNGIPEAKGTWIDLDTGIVCRMAIDLWMPDQRYLLDGKTTSKSAEWDQFRKNVENMHYDMQLAMYCDGVEAITGNHPNFTGWIAIEQMGPWEIELHLAHELYIEVGRWKYKTCLKKLKKCIETGVFPQRQHETDFQMPEPSAYYFKNYEGVTRDE